MNVQTRTPQQQPPVAPATMGATATLESPRREAVERSVLVQHGIHSGHFPVAGLRIREVRQTLSHLLNIDPRAVAVINGQVVSEDTVIHENTNLLSFVKPSAIKG
jgi:hypothetical protein